MLYLLIGLHITAVVKAVQLITNEFEFNSYIIYVLVIFFLQMNYDLPQTTNLAAKYTKTNKELGSMIYEFFHFYAKKYQNKSHIISARFGRWQQRKLNPAHRVFDDEMKKYLLAVYTKNCFFLAGNLKCI